MLTRDDVSRTARLVAACRALDAEQGGTIERPDTWARDLAGPEPLALAAELPALVAGIARRTRWLDDEIARFAARHPDGQVVLLGAGLDTRARRLGLPVRFFEIDLPAMLELKGRLLPGAGIAVPVDLRHERFADALLACPAFAPGAPTCLVWEGVSYYLPEEAVAATLDQARDLLPPGDLGLFLFDYVKASWLAAVQRAGGGGIVAQVASWREPMIFGFADLPAALAVRGLELVADVALESTGERWYAGRMAAARRR